MQPEQAERYFHFEADAELQALDPGAGILYDQLQTPQERRDVVWNVHATADFDTVGKNARTDSTVLAATGLSLQVRVLCVVCCGVLRVGCHTSCHTLRPKSLIGCHTGFAFARLVPVPSPYRPLHELAVTFAGQFRHTHQC